MKKLLYVWVLLSTAAFGQNRINYSQYMHNHQAFNPAFVEHGSDIGGSVLYRDQWMGFKGAPNTFVGDLYATAGRSNFDIQFLYDQITIYKHLEAGISYSYSIRLGVETLMSLGLKASYNQQTTNYDQLFYFDAGDPDLSGVVKKQGVNLGFGMFFSNPNWHAGLGAPYLFNNVSVDQTTNLYNNVSYQHFFLTGGYRAINNRDLTFYPTLMMKWTAGSPANISVDANFLIRKRFWASGGYRTDNTIILSAGIVLWKNFKIIYSYDLGLGKVNRYGGMTHEISMGYGLDLFKNNFTKKKYVKHNGGRMRVKRGRWR